MNSLGDLLRYWRTQKGLSQLQLAEQTETSGRHLSFIETGRGHPSRALLLRLAQELEIPLRSRNALLEAAGYSPQYGETGLTDPEMSQVLRVLDFMLKSSLPYPTMIIDRYWNITLANAAFLDFVRVFARKPELFTGEATNLMRICLHPDGLRPHIVNRAEFEPYMVGRVRRSMSRVPGDPELEALYEEITGLDGAATAGRDSGMTSVPQFMMPLHLQKDAYEIRLFTTIATLGAPQDITLQELFIETGFPVDDATEQHFRSRIPRT
jgi:transcriptional regulator with XRE-family HTH domain